ncbi:hypothetical protein [Zestomonas carbonaria]|uniref:SPOR domain-containing protein n=1 Tax=Zestomonas carbonaria TaxID=2762745 RepID=A0A7U7ELX4_9GAMM|nr:hypothetical protein [Pseudomonas carbonaria]CAD5107038.1 hypothetical protein PSEWESI4_01309 [Pseudomonas carbonaria]
MKVGAADWCVLRLDDNGNQFLVRAGLDRAQAEALARDFAARGHKQSYWAQPTTPGAADPPPSRSDVP